MANSKLLIGLPAPKDISQISEGALSTDDKIYNGYIRTQAIKAYCKASADTIINLIPEAAINIRTIPSIISVEISGEEEEVEKVRTKLMQRGYRPATIEDWIGHS